MLSQKSRYALKALLALARRQGQGPVLIAEVAEAEQIPRKFLEAILLTLRKQGLLWSKKGRGGGYALAVSPDQIPVGQVIRILDGVLAVCPCAGTTEEGKCPDCGDSTVCGVRLVMTQVLESVSGILEGTTIADMLECEERNRGQESGKGGPSGDGDGKAAGRAEGKAQGKAGAPALPVHSMKDAARKGVRG